MEKTKKSWEKIALFAGIFGFAMVFLIGTAFSYETNHNERYSEERHELMQTAFEENDYNAWLNLMKQDALGRQRVTEVVNQDNFNRFVDMHNAKLSGDSETEQSIREELGLGLGQGKNRQNKQQNCDGECDFTNKNPSGLRRGFRQ